MISIFLIALGASIGALLRYGTQCLVELCFVGTFPLHTMIINIIGAVVIGFFVGSGFLNELMPVYARNFFIVGILSSYTTFSAMILDMYILFENNEIISIMVYYIAIMVLSLLCFYVAMLCGKFLFRYS